VQGRALFPGIVYDRKTLSAPRPLVLHFVTIDLSTPGLRFRVTPPDDLKAKLPLRARRTSGFLREQGAQLAINGDFFTPWRSNGPFDYYPHPGDPVTVLGRACSDGVCYGGYEKRRPLPELRITRDNHAQIGVALPDSSPPDNIVSGNTLLLEKGEITQDARQDRDLNPRTAVGLDQSGTHLLILIIDGRQPHYSEGATMGELAGFLRDRGAVTAINLDGGGSATLAVQGPDGRPKVLNSTINHHNMPGDERYVANHLAVFVPRMSP